MNNKFEIPFGCGKPKPRMAVDDCVVRAGVHRKIIQEAIRELDMAFGPSSSIGERETPKMIERSLAEFDEEINKRKEKPNAHIHQVLRNVTRITTSKARGDVSKDGAKHNRYHYNGCCYLNDPRVRLRFLRAECFVVDKAVERMICYLEFMTELFGDYVAARPVRLSDFTRAEETALMNSRHHYLPFRDSSGRRVLSAVGNLDFFMESRLKFKIFMYMNWVISEDIETQKKGLSVVFWCFDEPDDTTTWETLVRKRIPQNAQDYHRKQFKALPVRIVSWQHYYPDTAFFRFFAALHAFAAQKDSPFRSIYKLHFGEQSDVLNKMSSNGVPSNLIPVRSSMRIKSKRQCEWVSKLRMKSIAADRDDADSNREIVDCPALYDVVFRRGHICTDNPGNAYYRSLIESYSLEYLEAGRETRFEISQVVTRNILSRNGRFLEWVKDKKAWAIILDKKEVRTKIYATFKQFNRNDNVRRRMKRRDDHSKRQRRRNLSDNHDIFGRMFIPVDGEEGAHSHDTKFQDF